MHSYGIQDISGFVIKSTHEEVQKDKAIDRTSVSINASLTWKPQKDFKLQDQFHKNITPKETYG